MWEGPARFILSTMKSFDLNKKVLKDRDVSDALREIIANAIDEELLTQTSSVRILKKFTSLGRIRRTAKQRSRITRYDE